MGCTRNLSKTWGKCFAIVALSIFLVTPSFAWGAVASQFSFTVGEQYNDNIFFDRSKEHDFITIIRPTLHLYYAPAGQAEPTLNLNISPTGLIYARHSELNTFGFTDTSSINGGYTYFYSPRLTFNLSNNFRRQGDTSLPGLDNTGFQVPGIPTSPPPLTGNNSSASGLSDFISNGGHLVNNFNFQGIFRYRPDISFSGGYHNTYLKFLQLGGTESSQTLSVRGIYNWRQEHNLHAGYSVTYSKPRNGESGLIHDFDFGDDYFTSQMYRVELTPTLVLSASTGLSINTSNDGPTIANNSTLTITKLWETASLASGFRKGLTPSFGVAGVSDTATLFSNFTIQLSEKISGNASLDFSLYDTDDVNFKTFQVNAGLQYWITTWLSSGLSYTYRSIDSGAGARNTDLLTRGTVTGSTVLLNVTARFDLWPNTGLARNMSSAAMSPVLRTPFPTVPAAPPSKP
jgi:hypothetical protein